MSDHDQDTPEPADERERLEAAALAQALERGTATLDLPEQALATAALLRHSAGQSELSAVREEAVLSDVLEVAARIAARPDEEDRSPSALPSLWRWFLGLTGAVAAAALLFVLLRPTAAPAVLPPPDSALVAAGISRLSDASADDAFHDRMRVYRGAVYSALGERYR